MYTRPYCMHIHSQKHAIYFASFLEMELYIDSVENNMYWYGRAGKYTL